MAKGRNKTNPLAKRRDETDLQWRSRLARAKVAERDRQEPLVTQEAAGHGDYEQCFVTHVETGTKASTQVNRGGGPVERWIAAKRLTQDQQAVIGVMVRLWRLAGLQQCLTANYGPIVAGAGCHELRAANEIEARQDLHRIQNYFPGPLKSYWNVFEAVCRHGMAAGVAGATDGYSSRSAQDRAHTIVCFVTDTVATNEGI